AVKNASGTDPEGRPLNYSKPCSRCDLLKLLKNLIDFIFMGLAPILGTFFVVWAGIQILLAGPNITSYQDGIHKLWIVVQALFILGLAWLITNTLIKSLGAKYDGADNWYQFTCTESATKPEFTVPPTEQPSGKLTEQEARRQLAAAGIGVNALPPQTQLEGIRQATIDEAIRLKNTCGCSVTITGGTEPGHTSRHSLGFKVDFRADAGLTDYIKKNYTYIGERGDGPMYRSPSGVVYTLEDANGSNAHWDVDVP
ncbi:MAG: hypothetical protein KW806_03525, partial [Candidatus Yanofskybacteria bacterium]|nr:hypothetical protein [Candidatus Yanofskybacteria bacterium]